MVLAIMVFSCHRSENVYYSNGLIHLKYEKLNGTSKQKWKVTEYDTLGNIKSISFENIERQMDGLARYFDENGHLIATMNFANGKKNGDSKWYYQNGQIKMSNFYVDDQRIDEQYYYNEDGSLKQISFYRIINGREHQNGILVYDEQSNIITPKSIYAEIASIADTIYTEYAEYHIDWVCSEDVYVRAFTGKYDKNFNLLDSSTKKTVDLDCVNVFLPKSEVDTLRVVFEFKEEKNGKIYGNTYYLDHVFYVRGK